MLSQLIVVDFSKGAFPIVYDELTRAYERTVSFTFMEERPDFDLHLFNYDKYYTNKADVRLVFILTIEPALGEPYCPWIKPINRAYRQVLDAELVQVIHEGVYTHCLYRPKAIDVEPPMDFKWIMETLPID